MQFQFLVLLLKCNSKKFEVCGNDLQKRGSFTGLLDWFLDLKLHIVRKRFVVDIIVWHIFEVLKQVKQVAVLNTGYLWRSDHCHDQSVPIEFEVLCDCVFATMLTGLSMYAQNERELLTEMSPSRLEYVFSTWLSMIFATDWLARHCAFMKS